ncbi:MAG: hypothetical protein EXS37_17245 [Opitutus sp.]|nr:hypothetical protein [Opitutus sp.]
MAHAVVTIAFARHYVARFGPGDTPARETRRWFTRASRKTPVSPAFDKSIGGVLAAAVDSGNRDEGVASPGVAGDAAGPRISLRATRRAGVVEG